MADEGMTAERAQEILGLGSGITAEERHRVFREKRDLLEKKLGAAPTPGLKAKYRASIEELEQAFEVLELAQTDADLGAIRPDLKTPTRPLLKVPPVSEPPPLVSPAVPLAQRQNRRREMSLAIGGVLLIVALFGGWFWKVQANKTAEQSRQAELAKQEAIARATKDEAARSAAEAKAALLRNEEEQRQELERITRLKLAGIETELSALDAQIRLAERTVNDLKASERDLVRENAGWEIEYVRRRRTVYEQFANQLTDHSVRHPVRARLKTAQQLLAAKDVPGAAAESAASVAEWEKNQQVPVELLDTVVGLPLFEYVIERTRTGDVSLLLQRLRLDEGALLARRVATLKRQLAYLRSAANAPVVADWRTKVSELRLWAGDEDNDYRTFAKRFLGGVRIVSPRTEAEISDTEGKFLGRTPLALTGLMPGSHTLTIEAPGYLSKEVTISVEPLGEKPVSVDLTPLGGDMRIADLGINLIFVRGGQFVAGSPTTEPGRDADEGQHPVILSRPYWLGRTEVTIAQWRRLMGTDLESQARKALNEDTLFQLGGKKQTLREWWGIGRDGEVKTRIGPTGEDFPITYVSWEDAMEYCARLTKRERAQGRLPQGYEYTLPSEAEWEHACRAGTTGAVFAGALEILGLNNAPALDPIAWYGGNSSVGYNEATGWETASWKEKQYPGGNACYRKVAEKRPNNWGFLDMLGNVSEWCFDRYGEAPPTSMRDPVNAGGNSTQRVIRGGSWSEPAQHCRAAFRGANHPVWRSRDTGFRVALVYSREKQAAANSRREDNNRAAMEKALRNKAGELPVLLSASARFGEVQENTVRLNRRPAVIDGERYDGVVLHTGDKPGSLAWSFVPPPNYSSWYILRVNGTMSGFRSFTTALRADLPSAGALAPTAISFVHLQGLDRESLSPNETYVIWFKFENDAPADFTVRATYVDKASVEPDEIRQLLFPDKGLVSARSSIVGKYAGEWRDGTNGQNIFRRVITINPDLRTGTDTVESDRGNRFTMPLSGEGTPKTFDGWNEPPSAGGWIADHLTIQLSPDGNSIAITLRDKAGRDGAGTLQRIE